MKQTYLISCMHQKDASIIERTGVLSDVVVINQSNHYSIEEIDFGNKKGKNVMQNLFVQQKEDYHVVVIWPLEKSKVRSRTKS